MATQKEFVSDIAAIRAHARSHLDQGSVTEGYRADRSAVIKILNDALATEIVCVLRYKRHYYMASGIHAKSVAAEFLEHANEEQQHADMVAKRITELGGNPNLDPEGMRTRSHAEYKACDTLEDMIREDLIAERIAVSTYAEIVRWNGPIGGWMSLARLTGLQYGVQDGDLIEASIVGDVITGYLNGVKVISVVDDKIKSGAPGIGFNFGVGNTNVDHGLRSFEVHSYD